jgi:hypothetical protein
MDAPIAARRAASVPAAAQAAARDAARLGCAQRRRLGDFFFSAASLMRGRLRDRNVARL